MFLRDNKTHPNVITGCHKAQAQALIMNRMLRREFCEFKVTSIYNTLVMDCQRNLNRRLRDRQSCKVVVGESSWNPSSGFITSSEMVEGRRRRRNSGFFDDVSCAIHFRRVTLVDLHACACRSILEIAAAQLDAAAAALLLPLLPPLK